MTLSKTDREYADLARRIRALFFLATPHKEADSQGVFENIQRASNPEKHIIQTPEPHLDLEEMREITDDFKRQIGGAGIQLWSFYETLKTNLGTDAAIVLNQRISTSGKHKSI